ALVVLVDAGHDAQQRRLARAVEPKQPDLRAREERKGDCLEELAFGRNDLAHADHRVDVLSHGGNGAATSASIAQAARIQEKKAGGISRRLKQVSVAWLKGCRGRPARRAYARR